MAAQSAVWPVLQFSEWRDTRDTLHLWTQIAGKISLALKPWLNHSWHVALQVSARGLTTAPIPHEDRAFEISFDFVEHGLRIVTSDGLEWGMDLCPMSVAQFYARLMDGLSDVGVHVHIDERPCEILDPIRFSQDWVHFAYDAKYANRFFRVLSRAHRTLELFRTGFLGKSSPVHFFWGSFDLAATRFSGRSAPRHPGGVPNLSDAVTREAYSHEVSSAGFWPGGPGFEEPVFYSYAYPAPPGFEQAALRPQAAFFSNALREFILPYDAVREASDPDAALLSFLQSAYEAAANSGGWDRSALECPIGRPGAPRIA